MAKKRKLGEVAMGAHKKGLDVRSVLDMCSSGSLTTTSLAAQLQAAVDHLEAETALQQAVSNASTGQSKRQRFSLRDCVTPEFLGRWLDISGADGARIFM
jgi:hypothetical protein